MPTAEEQVPVASEKRARALSEVSAEFFKLSDAISESVAEHRTVVVGGEEVPIGDNDAYAVLAQFQRLREIGEELKQAAEYRNDFYSAEAAAYYLDLADVELRRVQVLMDMQARYGNTAAHEIADRIASVRTNFLREHANDNIAGDRQAA